MESVTAFEAKSRFGELLDRVVKGEEVVITQREKPVARLVPECRVNYNASRKAVARLDGLRRRIASRNSSQRKLSAFDFKSAIEESRR